MHLPLLLQYDPARINMLLLQDVPHLLLKMTMFLLLLRHLVPQLLLPRLFRLRCAQLVIELQLLEMTARTMFPLLLLRQNLWQDQSLSKLSMQILP